MGTLVLVLHILFVAAWFGGKMVLAFASPMNNSAEAPIRRWWAVVQSKMARIYFNGAGILVLVTGVILVLDNKSYSFADAFVSVGFVAVIIGALLGIFVFGPGTREIVDAIDSGDEAKEKAANNRLAAVGLVDSLVLVLAVFAMVGAWGTG